MLVYPTPLFDNSFIPLQIKLLERFVLLGFGILILKVFFFPRNYETILQILFSEILNQTDMKYASKCRGLLALKTIN